MKPVRVKAQRTDFLDIPAAGCLDLQLQAGVNTAYAVIVLAGKLLPAVNLTLRDGFAATGNLAYTVTENTGLGQE